MAREEVLSLGDVARRLGYPIWKVRRMIDLYLPGITKRVGHYKMVYESSLPAIQKELETRCFVRENKNGEKP